jgi:two-component sensor histidine kinase
MRRLVTVDLRRRLRALGPQWMVAICVGLGCFALGAMARLVIDRIAPGAFAFGLIYPAALLSTLLARWRAGVVTVVVGGALAWYFVVDGGQGFALPDLKTRVNVVLFFASAALLVFLADQAVSEQDAGIADRDLLIEEINHRTRNNFQTVISLLELQARRTDAAPVKAAMEAAVARIGGIARLHSNLSVAGRAGEPVALDRYLAELCENLAEGPGVGGFVRIETSLQPASLPHDRAVAVGVILNELVTNAFKHAFPPGRAGVVQVALGHKEHGLTLTVADDGVGLLAPKKAARPASSSGLGRGLIDAFARQAGGTVSLEGGENGGALATLVLKP